MELAAVNSPVAALVAGLVTSLHCAGMCGPLACALLPVRGDAASVQAVTSVYHVARLTSYAIIGAVVGGLGGASLAWLAQPALTWLPWAMVVLFVALALRWDRFMPKPLWLTRLVFRAQERARGGSRLGAAAAMGLATPLLPCGPLYLLIALSALAGSALRGVEFMLAFGLGTVPLLWLAQTQFHWVRQKLSPLWLARVRVTLALSAAVVIGWRLRGTLGFAGPDVNSWVCF
ncbi:MAG: sulfite exporter TauE/SafE family protein [Opitutaceae bacterium]|nr:sulfite exporter TauE/SafE family protein [Opitutaceae bacterium]